MHIIATIHHKDLFNTKEEKNNKKLIRQSVRCLAFDQEKKLAIIYFPKYQHHILVGGELENQETHPQATHREMLEET